MKNISSAINLVEAIRQHGKPINGYVAAAVLSGEEFTDYREVSRNMGQVAKLIDYACFVRGLPFLATHFVRAANGDVHPDSWTKPEIASFKDEIVSTAAAYTFTDADFVAIIAELAMTRNSGAAKLWDDIYKKASTVAGFIRYNLHRKLRK